MTAVADSVAKAEATASVVVTVTVVAVTVVPAVLSATTAVETVLMVTEDVHLATATNGADSERMTTTTTTSLMTRLTVSNLTRQRNARPI